MENNLSIIVPAYNEEESLPFFLQKCIDFCKANFFKLIIVNDGSTDDSKIIIQEFCNENSFITVINHKVNKGYGGAIKSGIQAAQTKYIITVDADGQHSLDDVKKLFNLIIEKDADMIVGSRKGLKDSTLFRKIGKFSIRFFAKKLMPLKIHDINSGMKIYNTELAKKYISLCPNTMAFSDTILLSFVYQRHLVIEEPISINQRYAGKSTISISTAIETIKEILNIVVLFNPTKIFFPIAFLSITFGVLWGIPFLLLGRGVSNGALISIISGLLFFFLGLIAEQLSMLRRKDLNK
ncbi:MAG: glycosyltransferase family 2 protein [Bacteroidota bacterium]